MKRKIYIISASSPALNYGIGTYIDQLIFCLKKTEIEFDVVLLFSEVSEVMVVNKDGYRQILIPFVYINNESYMRYYMRNTIYLLKDLFSEDNGVLNIFHLNFTNSFVMSVYLRKMFKCRIIMVIHYTNWGLELQGDFIQLKSILKSRANHRSVIHNKIFHGFKEDVEMMRKCDRLICLTEHTVSLLIETARIDVKKTKVINNSLRDIYRIISIEDKNAIRQKYNILPQTKIIFYAGRLTEAKGVFELIKAFREISGLYNVRLIIAGDGDFDRLIPATKESCCDITFTGRLDNERLYQFYSIADIGVVPSIYEEFGLVAIEMMMHCLPVIVSDTGGLTEIVKDGINGLKVSLVIKEGIRTINVQELIQKLLLLLNHEDYASELGRRGRETFLEKYEISSFQREMLDLYLNI